MEDDEPLIWTKGQHLAAGLEAILQIEADRAHVAPEPVCHHFDAVDPIDPGDVSVEETYRHFVPLFATVGVEFCLIALKRGRRSNPSANGFKSAFQLF